MWTDEEAIKPLEVEHRVARQILAIRSTAYYWELVRRGLIKTVGSGRNSRADYASLEAYHHERLTAPRRTLKMNERGGAAPKKANEEIAAE